jgi:RNA polymerase sigma factor (sigma-70 family)
MNPGEPTSAAGESASTAEMRGTGTPAAYARQIEHLFRQHNDALLRFLTARTGSSQEAKDVAQEAYVKLLALDKPGTVGYLRAYLYQTAANLVKDRMKQRVRRDRIDTLMFFDRAEAAPSPEPLWDARQRLDLISRAIDELPALCRAAFILRKFDELSVEEVAERLSVNVRSVKRYLARALAHCERALEKEGL